MTITGYFDELKTKDIVCWGSGKHFRNSTYSFLRKSGLIDNLIGFADVPGSSDVEIEGHVFGRISRSKLANMAGKDTVILISATGYEDILAQIRADAGLADIEAVPSIFLEALYEDTLLLSADKPPVNYRKHDAPVIPAIIHGIWFSDNPMPGLYQRCLESWKKHSPGYEIRIWDLNTYNPGHCLFFEQAVEHKNWAFASDYARADILRRYGGVYMDLDVEMLRPIDDLLHNDAYMSFESLDRIECGSGMGATPGHPVLQEICESYENRSYLKPDGSWDNSTCPVRYTQIIEKHGLIKNGGFQFVDDITVYPFEVLTGKSFDTGIIYNTELSYTIHHHNGSWIPDKAHGAICDRYTKIRSFLSSKDIVLPGDAGAVSDEFEESSGEKHSGAGLRLFRAGEGIRISGSIDLGYIGNFKDSQIEIDDTPEEIREWDIVKNTLNADCTDDEIIAFLNRYFNEFIEKISRNIKNINGTFLLYVLTDMDQSEIDFMVIRKLFIEEKLFYGNEEDIAEIYNTVREGLNNLSVYLETTNDGTIPKGHIESVLRSFYPMFNFDCFLENIIPEYIGLHDGKISFQCSDRFDNIFLCGAYGVIDEDLCIKDWHNF